MVLFGAVCGAGVGLGVLLLVAGLRAPQPRREGRAASRRPAEPLLLRAVATLVAGVLTYTLTGWVIGAAMTATAVALLPASMRRARDDRALVGRTEAIAAWTEMLRDTLAAAAGLEQAIVTTAPTAPEPVRASIARLGRRIERGERLVVALRSLAEDLANPAADLVVAALVTAAEREARDLVPLLTSLAKATRAEAEMRMRVHASRARLRTAVRVVVGSLAGFGGGLIVFNPRYLEPYRSVEGQLVLLVVGAIFTLSYVMLQRMARIRVPERFLTRSAGAAGEVGA